MLDVLEVVHVVVSNLMAQSLLALALLAKASFYSSILSFCFILVLSVNHFVET